MAVRAVVEPLDTGDELPTDQARAVARALIDILLALPQTLVGDNAALCEKAEDRDEVFAALEGVEQVYTNVRCLPSLSDVVIDDWLCIANP